MKQYNSDVKPVLQEFSQDTLGVEAGVAAAITADQYSTLPPPPSNLETEHSSSQFSAIHLSRPTMWSVESGRDLLFPFHTGFKRILYPYTSKIKTSELFISSARVLDLKFLWFKWFGT